MMSEVLVSETLERLMKALDKRFPTERGVESRMVKIFQIVGNAGFVMESLDER